MQNNIENITKKTFLYGESIFKILLPFSILIFLLVSTMIYRVPSFLGYRIFYVPTNSMEQEIPAGTFVSARVIQDGDIIPGNIAVYKMGNRLVVHRIISFDGNIAVFKGDNNPFYDSPVPKERILYKVVHIFT